MKAAWVLKDAGASLLVLPPSAGRLAESEPPALLAAVTGAAG